MRTRSGFEEVITSVEQVRAIMGSPAPRAERKEIGAIDAHARAFIAKSPFVLVCSSDSRGRMDVSPKGDPPGFVQVLDDKTLAIPDRPGNRRADTFCNLVENPHVGLLFLVPGKRETLRVSGTAIIVRDAGLRESMAVNGKAPELAIVASVEQVFFHCAKCVIRSRLWQPEAWPDLAGLPSLAEALISHGQLTDSLADVQAAIDDGYATELY